MDEDIRVSTRHAVGVELTKVWLVGPHDLVTEALAARLAQVPDLRVLGRCAGDEVGRVRGQRPDVVVYDPVDGEDALVKAVPEAVVVALGGPGEPGRAVAAARAGVVAWVSHAEGMERLVAVIRGVRLGYAYWPPELLGPVLRALKDGEAGPLALLSGREVEVLRHLVDGLRGPDIAEAMGVSRNTVRTHAHRVYAKLGVHSRLAAVRVARAAGYTPRERRPQQME